MIPLLGHLCTKVEMTNSGGQRSVDFKSNRRQKIVRTVPVTYYYACYALAGTKRTDTVVRWFNGIVLQVKLPYSS